MNTERVQAKTTIGITGEESRVILSIFPISMAEHVREQSILMHLYEIAEEFNIDVEDCGDDYVRLVDGRVIEIESIEYKEKGNG